MKTVLAITCAWCGRRMGTKDGEGISGESSCMCPKCEKKETEKGINQMPIYSKFPEKYLSVLEKFKREV
jgi:hypothetical protein